MTEQMSGAIIMIAVLVLASYSQQRRLAVAKRGTRR